MALLERWMGAIQFHEVVKKSEFAARMERSRPGGAGDMRVRREAPNKQVDKRRPMGIGGFAFEQHQVTHGCWLAGGVAVA